MFIDFCDDAVDLGGDGTAGDEGDDAFAGVFLDDEVGTGAVEFVIGGFVIGVEFIDFLEAVEGEVVLGFGDVEFGFEDAVIEGGEGLVNFYGVAFFDVEV